MAHDFIRFPELRNNQLDFYYWDSPHKQIFEDFRAKVVKVTDGDTIRVETEFRDFDFPVRFLGINAPEMNEGGQDVQKWLEGLIIGQEVDILIDKNQRVGKWGRLLGKIAHRGMDLGQMMMSLGKATSFDNRKEGKIPEVREWF